jgi:hypothetical protein
MWFTGAIASAITAAMTKMNAPWFSETNTSIVMNSKESWMKRISASVRKRPKISRSLVMRLTSWA